MVQTRTMASKHLVSTANEKEDPGRGGSVVVAAEF